MRTFFFITNVLRINIYYLIIIAVENVLEEVIKYINDYRVPCLLI